MFWQTKKIGGTFDRITDSIVPTNRPDEEFRFIGLENIESGTGNLQEMKLILGKIIRSNKTIFKKGDVLYGKLRPNLNKVWLAEFDGICSTDIWALRAKPTQIIPCLLAALLRQSKIVNQVSAGMSGANLPRANKDAFDNIAISLPPLEIQKKIVGRLDGIAEAQKVNDQLIEKTDELFQSLLHRELDASTKDWEMKRIQDIAEVRSGFGFPMSFQGSNHGAIPFYKVSDMNLPDNEIIMSVHNHSITESQVETLKYNPAPAGTIIFPKIGAAIGTNKKRILSRESLYDNNVMGLIPNKNVLSQYLYFWLLKFNISLWASESMPPSIKKSAVEKFIISLPPIKVQKQIVAKLDAVQQYKTQLLAQKTKLKELFDSVLAKSMKGEMD